MAEESTPKPWELYHNESGYHYLTPDNTWETIKPTPGQTYSKEDYVRARDFAKQQYGQTEPAITKFAAQPGQSTPAPEPAQPDQPILQRLNAMASKAGGSLGSLLGGSLVPQQYAQTGENVGRSIGSAIGGGVVPSSYPELAALAASMVQPELLGIKALGPLAKMAYRVGMPALAAGTTAAVTGKEPIPAAATAAIGSGTMELGGLGVRATKWGAQTLSRGSEIQNILHDSSDKIVKAIPKDVPWLKDVADSVATLRQKGQDALSSGIEAVDRKIASTFGNTPIWMRGKGHFVGGAASDMPVPQSVPAALKFLREEKARVARIKTDDALKQSEQAKVDAMTNDVLTGLAKMDAKLGLTGKKSLSYEYQNAMNQYSKGKDILEMVKDPNVWFEDERGMGIHPIGATHYMNTYMEGMPATRFPNLWQEATRGGPIGVIDVLSKKNVHAYVPGSHIGANIPIGTQYKLAGKEVPPILKSGKVQPLADLLGIKGAFGLNNQE